MSEHGYAYGIDLWPMAAAAAAANVSLFGCAWFDVDVPNQGSLVTLINCAPRGLVIGASERASEQRPTDRPTGRADCVPVPRSKTTGRASANRPVAEAPADRRPSGWRRAAAAAGRRMTNACGGRHRCCVCFDEAAATSNWCSRNTKTVLRPDFNNWLSVVVSHAVAYTFLLALTRADLTPVVIRYSWFLVLLENFLVVKYY